jgi:hypothetical protein
MKTPEDQTSFEAEITSISFVDVDEIMILTGVSAISAHGTV